MCLPIAEGAPAAPVDFEFRRIARTLFRILWVPSASSRCFVLIELPAVLNRFTNLDLEPCDSRAIERPFKLCRLPAEPTLDQFQFTHHQWRVRAKAASASSIATIRSPAACTISRSASSRAKGPKQVLCRVGNPA